MTNTNAAGANGIAYNNILKLLQIQIPKVRSMMKSFDELLKEAMEADVGPAGAFEQKLTVLPFR